MAIIQTNKRPEVVQAIYRHREANPGTSRADAIVAVLPIVSSPGGVTVATVPVQSRAITATARTIVAELSSFIGDLNCAEIITAMTALVPVVVSDVTATSSGQLTFGATKTSTINLPPTVIVDHTAYDDILAWVATHPTEDDDLGFVLDLEDRYERIGVSLSGQPDFRSAFAAAGLENALVLRWEKRIQELTILLCSTWNNAVNASPNKDAQPYAEVESAILRSGVPLIMFRVLTMEVQYREHQITVDGQPVTYNIWTGIEPKTGLKPASVYDYLSLVYTRYAAAAFARIPEPLSYSNTEKALSIFDIRPYMKEEETGLGPDWLEFASRFTPDEWLILLAWIWATLYAKNKSRQIMNIYDPDGYSAKSVFVAVLLNILGSRLVKSIGKDSLSNQFGYSKIHDARLIVVPDNKNTHLVHTEKVHSITGGDLVDVEYKGRKSFSQRIRAKMLVCSNVKLEIDPNLRHEISRLIVIQPKITPAILRKLVVTDEEGNPIKYANGDYKLKGDAGFEGRLIEQAPSMLINAYQAYCKLCPTDADLTVPASVYETALNLGSSESDSYLGCLDIICVTDSSGVTRTSDLHAAMIERANTDGRFRPFIADREFGNFLDWLERSKGFKISRTDRGRGPRAVFGLSLSSARPSTHTTPSQSPMTHFNPALTDFSPMPTPPARHTAAPVRSF